MPLSVYARDCQQILFVMGKQSGRLVKDRRDLIVKEPRRLGSKFSSAVNPAKLR